MNKIWRLWHWTFFNPVNNWENLHVLYIFNPPWMFQILIELMVLRGNTWLVVFGRTNNNHRIIVFLTRNRQRFTILDRDWDIVRQFLVFCLTTNTVDWSQRTSWPQDPNCYAEKSVGGHLFLHIRTSHYDSQVFGLL